MKFLFRYFTSFAEEARVWQARARGRRVAALGGSPLDTPPLKVEQFTPTVWQDAGRALVENAVHDLGPDGFDEGTGSVLDRLVHARVDRWLHRTRLEHAEFLARAAERLDQTRALSDQLAILHAYDRQRLKEAEIAVERILDQVTGPATRGEHD